MTSTISMGGRNNEYARILMSEKRYDLGSDSRVIDIK